MVHFLNIPSIKVQSLHFHFIFYFKSTVPVDRVKSIEIASLSKTLCTCHLVWEHFWIFLGRTSGIIYLTCGICELMLWFELNSDKEDRNHRTSLNKSDRQNLGPTDLWCWVAERLKICKLTDKNKAGRQAGMKQVVKKKQQKKLLKAEKETSQRSKNTRSIQARVNLNVLWVSQI